MADRSSELVNMTEDCFFCTPHGDEDPLFACYYAAEHPAQPALVLVPPIGRERLRCYRELALLGRGLAARGHAVLRFDYRGEGESAGRFQEHDLTTRVEDTVSAVHELQRRSGCEQICLLGLRLGALVALMAAEQLRLERLILCDPICSPRRYARSLLRANLILQNQYFGGTTDNEAALRARLKQGEAISIHGFPMAHRLLDELEAIDPDPLLRRFRGRAALLHIAPREAPPRPDLRGWGERLAEAGEVSLRCVVMKFSWTSRSLWGTRITPLEQAVADWLERPTPRKEAS